MAKSGCVVEWARELGLDLENEFEAVNPWRQEALSSLVEFGYELNNLIRLSSQEIMHLEFQHFDTLELILEKFDSEKEYLKFGLIHEYITEDLITSIREELGQMDQTKLNSILDEYNESVSVESTDVVMGGCVSNSSEGVADIDVCV